MAEINNLPAEVKGSLPFQIMDLMDDRLIIAELEGRLPSVLTYHFEGKDEKGERVTIWGLSKSGVDEATAELSKGGEVIRELELIFTDGKDEGFFQVKSGRYVLSRDGKTEILLDTKIGTKRQTKKHATGSLNPFWYEQGCMKAARNAAMRLIPATIKQAVIEYAKKEGKVKNISESDVEQPITEEKKMESAKFFGSFHDGLVACKSLPELATYWKDNAKSMKKNLIPEHFSDLEKVKDDFKKKFQKEEENNG